MAFFILLAILFLILWLVERNKTKAYGNLKAEKEAADSYVASKPVSYTHLTLPTTPYV